jgi:type I restriction enzyme S subunit
LNGENLLSVGNYYVMNGGITPSGFYDSYNTPGEIISVSEGGNSCGYVQYNDLPFWSGGHCYTLLPQPKYRDVVKYRYLYHYLKFHQDDIMAMRIGSGLPNIQKKDLERFQVVVPETQIQERYTVLFVAVDNIIALEKALLNKLIERKMYIVSQVFI